MIILRLAFERVNGGKTLRPCSLCHRTILSFAGKTSGAAAACAILEQADRQPEFGAVEAPNTRPTPGRVG